MKTTFNFSVYLIVFVALIIITGCNKDTNSENTISFWHFWSEPNQREVLDSLISVFEKENNCNVELTELSWNDGKTKLMAAFNSKTAPDVLELGSDWVAQFSSAGVLQNLNKDSLEFNNFIDFAKNPGLWKNKLYAMPWVVDTRVLFYNKDLLKKAGLEVKEPTSFNEILNQAPMLNSLPEAYAFGANGSDAHRLYKKIVTFFWTNGGDILDANGNITINNSKNAEALGYYVQLSRNGYLETQRQIDAAFAQGKIAYWISGAWLLTKIKNENPSMNYGISLIPQLNGKTGISFAGGEYLAISKQSKKSELSKKFVKFMTNGKNSLEFCKRVTEAGFPADKRYYKDKYYQAYPERMVFNKQLESSRMTPVHPKWLELEEIIEEATVKALYGEETPKEALDNAQEKALLLVSGK